MQDLQHLRTQIDKIDREMAALFEERMGVAAHVAEYKKQNGLPVLDASREDAVLQRNAAYIKNPGLTEYYTDFQRYVMALSRQFQMEALGKNRVAYQGAEGAFTYQAARHFYPHAELTGCATFAHVFEAVENGDAAWGVVPFENSTTGDVSGVLDLCYAHNCYITAMLDLGITQNLLGLPGATLAGITTVYSHEQALQQSRRFLQSLGAQQMPYANTALAARFVAEQGDPHLAAVASLEAAELYGLVPLAQNIASEDTNTTRFIVLSKQPPSGGDRFSLLVTVENGVGRLASVIAAIAEQGFDMENIKSRPMPHRPWEYYFYIELVGAPDSGEAKKLLQKIGEVCLSVRMLGIYHRSSKM